MRKHISWIVAIIWMVIIYILSSQVAYDSAQLSSGIAQVVAEFILKMFPKMNITLDDMHHLIRKSAHFSEYFILGVLTINALKQDGLIKNKRIIVAVGFCSTYAIFDEFHQRFVSGRSASFTDVLIDSCGAIIGVIIFLVINRIVIKRKLTQIIPTNQSH